MLRYIKYFDYMWINSFINIDLIIYVFIIDIIFLVIIFFVRLILKDFIDIYICNIVLISLILKILNL